jgi:hypothetical protein
MCFIIKVAGYETKNDDFNEQAYIQEELEITGRPFNTIKKSYRNTCLESMRRMPGNHIL